LTDECIHGFEGTQCAICFPKAAPDTPARPSGARSTTRNDPAERAKRPAAATPRRQAGAPGKIVDIAEQRLFHFTRLSNLESIAAAGALLAPNNPEWAGAAEADISAAATRDGRNRVPVGDAGLTVADYVPFVLTPDAFIWHGIRGGVADPRLVRNPGAAGDFVLLITTVGVLRRSHDAGAFALSSGDVASPVTRFFTVNESIDARLRSLRGEEQSDQARQSEFLVADHVPFSEITMVATANDPARKAVRAALAGTAHAPKVSVYPPWFQPA
jgi:hypothetical protein